MSPTPEAPPRLAVVVPCRDEAAVLPRKLANLALAAWPPAPAGGRHVVVVVDDGSRDDTAAVARRSGAELAERCDLIVLANDRAPGKAGAIATALDALEPSVELIVLTDADVIARPDALAALARAFAREPELTLACGAQEFVRDLAGDGTCRGADGGPTRPAGGLYDRWTAAVRRLESRSGRLFSVHGQLLAWRASQRLRPTPGVAADDLDLMLQVRRGGGRVRLVAQARFLEVKTPPGAARDGQALRRARAYFQAIGRSGPGVGGGALDRAQLGLYRSLPAAAPWLSALAAAALPLVAWRLGGTSALAAVALLLALLCAAPAGRRFGRLMSVIARAWWRERQEPISDRWEMERT